MATLAAPCPNGRESRSCVSVALAMIDAAASFPFQPGPLRLCVRHGCRFADTDDQRSGTNRSAGSKAGTQSVLTENEEKSPCVASAAVAVVACEKCPCVTSSWTSAEKKRRRRRRTQRTQSTTLTSWSQRCWLRYPCLRVLCLSIPLLLLRLVHVPASRCVLYSLPYSLQVWAGLESSTRSRPMSVENTQVQNEREKSRGGRDMLFAETPLRPPLLVLPPHAAPHTFLQRRAEARLPASHLQPRAPLLSSGLDSAVRQTSRQKGAAVGRCYDALTLPYFYRRGYAGRRAVARGGSRRNTTFRYCRCRCCCRRHSINVNHGVCCRGDAACRLHHHQRTPLAQ